VRAEPSVNDTSLRIPAEDRSREIVFSNGSYVDGPLASVFISVVNGWRPSVICPACWRGLGPLALMKSDDPRLPIKGASSGLLNIAECPMVFDRLAVSFITSLSRSPNS
jgi:hypothetical protein